MAPDQNPCKMSQKYQKQKYDGPVMEWSYSDHDLHISKKKEKLKIN